MEVCFNKYNYYNTTHFFSNTVHIPRLSLSSVNINSKKSITGVKKNERRKEKVESYCLRSVSVALVVMSRHLSFLYSHCTLVSPGLQKCTRMLPVTFTSTETHY